MADRILIFYGSYRSDRQGIRLADYLVRSFKERGADVELIDAKAVGLPILDRMYKEHVPGEAPAALETLAEKIRTADAFVFVTGEYNWGVQRSRAWAGTAASINAPRPRIRQVFMRLLLSCSPLLRVANNGFEWPYRVLRARVIRLRVVYGEGKGVVVSFRRAALACCAASARPPSTRRGRRRNGGRRGPATRRRRPSACHPRRAHGRCHRPRSRRR